MLPKVKVLVRFSKHIHGGHIYGMSLVVSVQNPENLSEVNAAIRAAYGESEAVYDEVEVICVETPEQAASRAAALAADRLQFVKQRAWIKANHEFPGKENQELRVARVNQLLHCHPWFSKVLEGWAPGQGLYPAPSIPAKR